ISSAVVRIVRSDSPSRSSVLRQKLQTALLDAAEANSTGAPQFGQAAVQRRCACSVAKESAELLEQLGLLGGELLVGQDALGLEVAKLLEQGHDLVGAWRRRRSGRCRGATQALSELLGQQLAHGQAGPP